MNSIRNLITRRPTIKLASTPHTKYLSKLKSGIFTMAAAATIGADKRKENLAALSLSSPK